MDVYISIWKTAPRNELETPWVHMTSLAAATRFMLYAKLCYLFPFWPFLARVNLDLNAGSGVPRSVLHLAIHSSSLPPPPSAEQKMAASLGCTVQSHSCYLTPPTDP